MPSPLTPSERSQRARIAALTRWAREDPVAATEPARRAFAESFIDQVDPDRILPEAERLRRAECARRAYYQRLAFASAKARRLAAEGRS